MEWWTWEGPICYCLVKKWGHSCNQGTKEGRQAAENSRRAVGGVLGWSGGVRAHNTANIIEGKNHCCVKEKATVLWPAESMHRALMAGGI